MRKKLHKKIVTLCVLTTSLLLQGCSAATKEEEEKPDKIEEGFVDYDKILDDGDFYVRNTDGSYQKVYLGNATFDKGSVNKSEPTYDKIAWYKEDFEDIPILYKGGSLIMYTKHAFEEEFVFERFFDYGYSIGLRNLEETPSGRYMVSTEKEDGASMVSYPGGDTSEIEDLFNEGVIIDTLGGVPLRKDEDEENGTSFLTKAGTIGGLVKDGRYAAEIYDGTKRHEYVFKADVRILGEFETFVSNKYEFESETIINIEIPEDWNSGYYMINGLGLFIYVAEEEYSEDINFNIRNKDEEDDEDNAFKEEIDYEQEKIKVPFYNGDYAVDSTKFKLAEDKKMYLEIITGNLSENVAFFLTTEDTREGTLFLTNGDGKHYIKDTLPKGTYYIWYFGTSKSDILSETIKEDD